MIYANEKKPSKQFFSYSYLKTSIKFKVIDALTSLWLSSTESLSHQINDSIIVKKTIIILIIMNNDNNHEANSNSV